MVERIGPDKILIKDDTNTLKLSKAMRNSNMWDKVKYLKDRPALFCTITLNNCILTLGSNEVLTLREGVAKCAASTVFKREYDTSVRVVKEEE